MKAVQVGILVVLMVCAGLLYKVYRGQRPQPAAAPASQPVVAATPAPAAPVAVQTAAAPALPPAPVETAPAPRRKPAPSRRASAVSDPPEVAENRTPAPDPTPAPAPAPVLPAAQPQPVARPAVPMNPPPGTLEAPPAPRRPRQVTIPAGALITVRLAEAISSDKNHPGDVFSATLDQPVVVDGLAIAERGAHVEGKVIEAQASGRVKGSSDLAVQLTRLHTSDGQDVAITTEKFSRENQPSRGDDVKKVGGGAVLGAIIGAIAGGGKGAAIGAGAGGAAGGGVAVATHPKPVQLPVETRLTFRLQQPVTLTERVE